MHFLCILSLFLLADNANSMYKHKLHEESEPEKTPNEICDEAQKFKYAKEMSNEELLGAVLATYFCEKFENQEAWTRQVLSLRMVEDKMEWDPEGVQEFAVRGEKIFSVLNQQFGSGAEELLTSLSQLKELKGQGNSDSLFYASKDGKFLVKSIRGTEVENAENILDKYALHMLDSGSTGSLLNRFHLMFRVRVWDIVDPEESMVLEQVLRDFVVLNNVFRGANPEHLLKFDLKGTYSPGSAVQHAQKQGWWTKEKSPKKSVYREYDFMGIDRVEKKMTKEGIKLEEIRVEAFFKNPIELKVEKYEEIETMLRKDAKYLTANNINDYSLVLGVSFHTPPAVGADCIPAVCHNCKSLPGEEYKGVQHICLYMGVVDLLTVSDEREQQYQVEMLQRYRQLKIDSMDQLDAYHLEVVSPIPTYPFSARFLATLLGCVFQPRLHLPALPEFVRDAEILRLGLMAKICHSFGIKHENVAQLVEKKQRWATPEIVEVGENNIKVHQAFDAFREMMDNWGTPSWELLTSMSNGYVKNWNWNKKESLRTKDQKYLIEKLSQDEANIFDRIFVNYYKMMSGKAGQNSMLPRYYALLESKNKIFVVRNNAFVPESAFYRKFDSAKIIQSMDPLSPRIPTTDFQKHFLLKKNFYDNQINQLDQDTQFLQEHELLNYKILIGQRAAAFGQNDIVCSLIDILNADPKKDASSYREMIHSIYINIFRIEGDTSTSIKNDKAQLRNE